MARQVLSHLLGPMLLAGTVTLAASPSFAAVSLPANFVDETIVTGLSEPNSLAFLPDGRGLITEQRTGNLRLVANGVLRSTPLVTVPGVNFDGYERGLQGVAVDPRWPQQPYIYLFHNHNPASLSLVRYTASGDLVAPTSHNLTLGAPYYVLSDLPDTSPNHNAGCLRFATDGTLFVSLGEDEQVCTAQDSTSLRGAILRLDVSRLPAGAGGPPEYSELVPFETPLVTTSIEASLVYAYGFRNPWRLHIDPFNNRVYCADVGEEDFEEMNEVLPGLNYGWPYREGQLVMDRSGLCPEPGGANSGRFRAPVVSMSRTPSLTAIVSAGVYRWPQTATDHWPGEYEGDLFYAEYYSGFLRRLKRVGANWQPATSVSGQPNGTDWATGLNSAVDFLVGPDGSMWWLSQFGPGFSGAGSLHRIRFVGVPLDSPPGRPVEALMSATPNPFIANTDLWFRLATQQPVRLTIHDASGRRVRSLWSGVAPAGDQRVPWDGLGDDGRAVPAGVYLARLERSGAVVTTRVMRLH